MKEEIEKDIYPVTVICDRYTGTYSGALWTAWNLDFWEVPREVEGDDSDCWNFWGSHTQKAYPVGRGNSPQEAFDDLCAILHSLSKTP